ncbi:MAG: bifunctional nuclease family protein [Candidatus Rokubacteria bacterium]|nr:bifunctional nuclease family protein [Candidatus Rokubacteria bacterium]
MWVEMKVKGVALDPLSNMPIIILRDEDDKRSLPIWVGIFEANAIAVELEKVPSERPMTHDLIKNLLDALDARVAKIVVNDLRKNTFFALIHLQLGSAEITVDARPSDAIALALRVGAPIFVEDEVVSRAKSVEVTPEGEAAGGQEVRGRVLEEESKIKQWLDSITPEDFGSMERGKDPNRPPED